ncbi:hypothetical protein B0H17DRAFT_1154277 [Mycena rosella]|uniref:Uncharacterized protein n=1 Tax=Mycena rosella TaxID=1033263 RepID=A0AAD7AZF9_MYCRO|nr:hypothetical protein B0H17DRAFT_1154277 [Mycena rosella]
MSVPNFSSSTTADEVATAFSNEIKGKNGEYYIPQPRVIGLMMNSLNHRYLAQRDRVRGGPDYFEVCEPCYHHGYNSERLELSEAAIKKDVPSANIRPLLLDLSSLAAVRKAAVEFNAYLEPLHVLIHNAVAPAGPFKLTIDNLESQMATNHIGPFLLTKLLAPKLLAAGSETYTPRVIFVSSIAQASGTGVNFSTLAHPAAEKYNSFDAYFQAKTANVLAAIELSKRAKGRLNAYSLHPGLIYTNIYQKEEVIADLQVAGLLDSDGKPNPQMPWKTMAQGAATTVAAAFDPRLDGESSPFNMRSAYTPGAFLSDCVEANKDLATHSSDPGNAEKLWTVTEDIIGENFVF